MNTPYRVILDYAHAPDALSNILRTCRTFTKKRLIALFGCGGDRDKGKRPIMGRIGWRNLAAICASAPMTIRARDRPDGNPAPDRRQGIEVRRRAGTSSSRTVGTPSATRWKSGGKATSSFCAARVTRRIRRQWASSGRSTRKSVVQELLTELRGE